MGLIQVCVRSCSKDREKEGKNKKRQEEDRVSVLRTDTEKKQMFSPEHQDVEQLSPETKKLSLWEEKTRDWMQHVCGSNHGGHSPQRHTVSIQSWALAPY